MQKALTQLDQSEPSPAPPPNRSVLLEFLALLAPYLLLTNRFWYVTDDAFITFRYARNLAAGRGLRYNAVEIPPVEGYSNFLWTLVCAAFDALHLDLTFWPLCVSVACGGALLLAVHWTMRQRLQLPLACAFGASLTLAAYPPFAVWSTGGLETMLFCLLLFVTVQRLILRTDRPDGVGAGIAGLLLALTRVEGIAWALVIGALALLSRAARRQAFVRPLLLYFAIVGVGFSIYFAWRWSYYGEPFSNTIYAKATLSGPYLERGFNYVAFNFLTFLVPLAGLLTLPIALRRDIRAVALPMAALTLAFPLYAMLTTGDFMAMGRFLIPAAAFQTLLFGWLFQHFCTGVTSNPVRPNRLAPAAAIASALGLSILAVLPAWNIHVVPAAWRDRFDFRNVAKRVPSEFERWTTAQRQCSEWIQLGRGLRAYALARMPTGFVPSVVLGAIGAIGYYSEYDVFDRYGLVTPEVAKRRIADDEPVGLPGHDKIVPWTYFANRKPTIAAYALRWSANPGGLALAADAWAAELRASTLLPGMAETYAPDFAAAPELDRGNERMFIFVQRRVADGASARDAWDEFESRVRKYRASSTWPTE